MWSVVVKSGIPFRMSYNLFDGETSADGKWTLLTTSCLGICGVGPVMVIDSDIYGNVEPGQVHTILAKYQ